LELYRRNFQFHQPIFPPDEDDLGPEEEEDDTHNDSVILINGGQIEAREIRDSPDQKSTAHPNRRNMMNGEETKINFFDPS
jgi:hypothetical protein